MPILFQVNVTSVFCLGKTYKDVERALNVILTHYLSKCVFVLEGTWGNRKKNQYELQKQSFKKSQLCSQALRLN